MGLKNMIPGAEPVIREGIIVLGGILIAAVVISLFPKVQKFVQDNGVTLKDSDGNVLF